MADRLNWKNSRIWNFLIHYKPHMMMWAVFIFWESIVVGIYSGYIGTFGNYAIHYLLNISIFYLHVWLLEKATVFPRNAPLKITALVLAEISMYIIVVYWVDSLLFAYTNIITGELADFKTRVFRLLHRGSMFMLFSTGYFFLKRYLSEKSEKERIEKQRFQMLIEREKADKELAMSKNAFLKAQINPHLLFNTFEFIHQKIRQHDPADAQIMIHLSDMMRFAATTEHNRDYIKLHEEITQCQNLIKLHEFTQQQVYIEFAYSPDVLEVRLIPLVLLTMLENMFKHGQLSDPYNKATVDIYRIDEVLKIESRNLPGLIKSNIGFGSGLDNIKTRLDYAYGNSAQMESLIDEDGFYCLSISIEEDVLTTAFDEKMKDIVAAS
ncbi:histidine kinase [Pedobacter sp. HDW13]|uniref:sensor histidine kinase n=1 Tax=unclassified Pedobacter TaxID=2628915 RepID=UPI000F59A74B|nr:MULTISPECIES: histidine kinase [unclassified Pedobacter]QIL42250.1 histidine kinase [Pedobacter sp. HDW13]RQO76509.1 hypothetical protein DBR40_11420 [Pedobacter sp. KBW01]